MRTNDKKVTRSREIQNNAMMPKKAVTAESNDMAYELFALKCT